MDSMLFQIELLDAKGMGTIFDSVFFFFNLGEMYFLIDTLCFPLLDFVVVMLPLKTLYSFLFCGVVYAEFVVVIFAFAFHREIILNSIKIPELHQDKRGDL